MEYFHYHARIERIFLDGFRKPVGTCMSPELSRPEVGLEVKEKDVAQFKK